MKPFLCFLGGCEFEYIIHELKSKPEQYFDFDYFHSFEHRGQTNPYTFLSEHAGEVSEMRPDVVVLSQHDLMMEPIRRIQLNRVGSREEQEEQLKKLLEQCELMIILLSGLNIPIVMQFFPWFRTNMLNRFKHSANFHNEERLMRLYVTGMEELTGWYANFYFLNLTNVCGMHGFRHTMKQADAPWYSHFGYPAAVPAKEYADLINYLLRRDTKVKCVIVDLDDTKWKGVIRDVGVERLEIGIDRERFRWNVLAILQARGILTGVISKNDAHLEPDIREFIRPHLSGTEFVCFVLNWKDKWENLQEVQQRLNIGLDSIAFIDDSAFEREQMKAMLPEVRVYDENIFERLLYLPEFQTEFVTEESRKRASFYIDEQKRENAQGQLTREDFFSQCEFKIEVGPMRACEVDRVTELVERTNQLNTSINRYSKGQIIGFGSDASCDIFTVKVCDKFGDYGLVGVCIGFRRGEIYEIDTLLFSCRVMSRGVEDYTLSTVLNHARAAGCSRAVVRFKHGPKNEQMRAVLSSNGFSESGVEGELVVYGFDMVRQQIKPVPTWFSLAGPAEELVSAAGVQAGAV